MKYAALLLCAALVTTPAAAQSFDHPLAEKRLAEMRGGFDLPGGLSVAMAVTTNTQIDGRMVLQTILTIDRGAPQLAVLASPDGTPGSLVAVDPNAATATAGGVIQLTRAGDQTRVTLNGQSTQVTHLLGGALGSLVANSGSDRSIDVSTTVDLAVSNASPQLLGSALLRVDALAIEASAGLVRGPGL